MQGCTFISKYRLGVARCCIGFNCTPTLQHRARLGRSDGDWLCLHAPAGAHRTVPRIPWWATDVERLYGYARYFRLNLYVERKESIGAIRAHTELPGVGATSRRGILQLVHVSLASHRLADHYLRKRKHSVCVVSVLVADRPCATQVNISSWKAYHMRHSKTAYS